MSENFKQEKLKNFTVIRNEIIEDKDLSLKALGLAVFMLHLPPDWEFSVAGLSVVTGKGESTIKTSLKELEERGYLKREQAMKDGKFGHMIYIITDKLKRKDFTSAENTLASNATARNHRQINTKETTTNETSTKSSSLRSEDIYGGLPENLTEALKDFELMRKEIKKPIKSDRARTRLLNKLDSLAGEDTELKIAILDQSIFNNWQDVYELKGDKTYGERMGQIHDRGTSQDSRGLADATDRVTEGICGSHRPPKEAFSFSEFE